MKFLYSKPDSAETIENVHNYLFDEDKEKDAHEYLINKFPNFDDYIANLSEFEEERIKTSGFPKDKNEYDAHLIALNDAFNKLKNERNSLNNNKVISLKKSKNIPITKVIIPKQIIPQTSKEIRNISIPKSKNIVVNRNAKNQVKENNKNVNEEEEINEDTIKNYENILNKENDRDTKDYIYKNPNTDKIITDMKRYMDENYPNNLKETALGRLKDYLNLKSKDDVIPLIPNDINDYKNKNEHENLLNILPEKIKLLKENISMKSSADYIKTKEPVINAISKFNSQMNRLLIFFKGKIKPNLKIIKNNDIIEALNDMNILQENFNEVYLLLNNNYHNIFGVKKLISKKSDVFLETLYNNFNKISSQIIADLKSYSNISSYTVGGMLMLNSVKNNLLKGNKYLL